MGFRQSITTAVCLLALLGLTSGCASPEAKVEDQLPPGAASNKFATPLDLARARAECMQSKGWDSKLNEDDGTVATSVPVGMNEKFDQDDAACFVELGVDPNRSLTSKEFDTLYDQYTVGAECLKSAGFSSPEPPSRQVFEDTYDSSPWIPWTSRPSDEIPKAMEACPMPQTIF